MSLRDNVSLNPFTVTPSDTVNQPFEALYVGATGNVAIVNQFGVTVPLGEVPVGVTVWVAGVKVNATGTDASIIVGMN